jgi:hypothetical protein
MVVKHWSFAGLLLTYRCPARCRCCYVCSGPDKGGDMGVAGALGLWRQLQEASPHGCRVHIGGGEPFLCWETLRAVVRQAKVEGLSPLEAVETNAYWATDDAVAGERLRELAEAGMAGLAISADPDHQEFIPIANVRRLARVAEEMLGAENVKVRWRDWAENGCDLIGLSDEARREILTAYALQHRERLGGRAAVAVAPWLELQRPDAFAGVSCGERLLRCRHVHVDADGVVCPGVCAGIVLGRAGAEASIADIWQRLNEDFARRPVLGALTSGGPVALAKLAEGYGYESAAGLPAFPQPGAAGLHAAGYAGACHLCWEVRRWLFAGGHCLDELGPASVYEI